MENGRQRRSPDDDERQAELQAIADGLPDADRQTAIGESLAGLRQCYDGAYTTTPSDRP